MSMAVQDTAAYQPATDLASRVLRRVLPLRARRDVSVRLDRPIICLTFDDVPQSVTHNALPRLEARGWRATLYVATGLMGVTNHHGRMMDEGNVLAAADAGHEIAAHGHAHIDMSASYDALEDIHRSHARFAELGLPAPLSFAWPYGQATPELKSRLASRYTSMRGIGRKVHARRADLNQLGSVPMFNGPCIAQAHAAIDRVACTPGLLTLFTHDVRDTPSAWGCTPGELEGILAHIDAIDADVLTVANAVERITP